jgi:hypothetical protein
MTFPSDDDMTKADLYSSWQDALLSTDEYWDSAGDYVETLTEEEYEAFLGACERAGLEYDGHYLRRKPMP